MKLLFDQNLSHRLAAAVQTICPHSTHVRNVGLERAGDEAVWNHALEHGFCIVTQDADFLERALLRGTPPAVICLRLGNTSTANTQRVLLERLTGILESSRTDPPPHIWEID